MKFLWFTWKDKTHPLAGGAEVCAHEIASRLVRDGHEVTFIVGGYDGCLPEELRPEGYKVIRVGTRNTVYYYAWKYYRQHLRGWADQVIDEWNAMPFFATFYVNEPVTLLVHHITGPGWLRQIGFPINVIGFLLEPFMLFSLSHMQTLTVSESTKKELIEYGFYKDRVTILPEGINWKAIPELQAKNKAQPLMIFVSAFRSLKRPLDVIEAFEIAKEKIPGLMLKMAGPMDDGGTGYGARCLNKIKNSKFASSIEYLGKVSQDTKRDLYIAANVICVASRKEGWGLIVTEANSQGTPAIAYNVPGLRDSVRDGVTGVLTKQNTPEAMAAEIVSLLQNDERYERLRTAAWNWSKEFSFENTYQAFIRKFS